MKLQILSAVIVTSSFSPYNGQVGLVLSGNANYSEVIFWTERGVMLPGEIVPLPNYFKLGADKFITVCAWCKDRNRDDEKKMVMAGWHISHGLCPACKAAFKPGYEKKASEVSGQKT